MSIPFTWVYLIYDPFTGLHKIGKSDDPDKRLRQLRSVQGTIPAAPTDYVLVEAYLCEETVEQEKHEQFASRRVRGEWFNLSTDDLDEFTSGLLDCRRFKRKASILEEYLDSRIEAANHDRIVSERYAATLERALMRASLLGYTERQKLLNPALIPGQPSIPASWKTHPALVLFEENFGPCPDPAFAEKVTINVVHLGLWNDLLEEKRRKGYRDVDKWILREYHNREKVMLNA